jgi:hypothetical protein
MSSEDIWNDPDNPLKDYVASLVDWDDGNNLGSSNISNASDDAAWAAAYEWAMAECRKAHKKGRLNLTGGSIYGARSAEIDPFANP